MLVLPARPFGARECKLELEVSISASALRVSLAHPDGTTAAGEDGPSPQPSHRRMGRGRMAVAAGFRALVAGISYHERRKADTARKVPSNHLKLGRPRTLLLI